MAQEIIEKHLWEIDLGDIAECVILIDIDGTIAVADTDTVESGVSEALQALQERNRVFLFSNNINGERLASLARSLNVPHIASSHRKPDPRVLRDIPNEDNWPLVVIGDKALTDGLFAEFVAARFIKVRRVRGAGESNLQRFTYWVDDLSAPLVKAIKRHT
ncbi:MAG TPA: hypothetical protein VNM40_00500 [Candidatus Paceibacterota bacterium]|nr:hypothetical protein [Candidatus Paceibacterota bacterium]